MIHQAQLLRTSAIQFLVVLFLSVLGTAPARATELRVEGGKGGGYFKSECAGDYVVGVYLKYGAWVDAIGLKCATFDSTQGRFKRPPGTKAPHGGQGGQWQTDNCPGDRFVSGIKFGFTREGNRWKYLDYVELTCSPVAGGEVTKICLHTGDKCWDDHPNPPPRLESFMSTVPVQTCPAGEWATGIHGRSGSYVDALGLICGPKPVVSATIPPPKPIKPLGKRPKIVTAKDDVDVYDSPVEPRRVIAMMAGGAQAKFLEYHRDGWCKLDIPTPKVIGWVAQDHLTGCP